MNEERPKKGELVEVVTALGPGAILRAEIMSDELKRLIDLEKSTAENWKTCAFDLYCQFPGIEQ